MIYTQQEQAPIAEKHVKSTQLINWDIWMARVGLCKTEGKYVLQASQMT